MKRIVALLVCCTVLFSIYAAAEEATAEVPKVEKTQTNQADNYPSTLFFDDIESRVKEKNQVIRANQIVLNNMKDNSDLEDMIDLLEHQADLLDAQAQNLLNLSASLSGSNIQGSITIDGNNISYSTMSTKERETVQATATAVSTILKSNASSLRSQAENMEVSGFTYDKTNYQLSQVADQLAYSTESMFIGYHTMMNQIATLKNNLETLDRNIAVMKKRYELGQIAEIDVLNIQANRSTISSTIQTLEYEAQNMIGEINVMLGRTFDSTLTMSAMPQPDLNFINTIDYATDRETARANNWDLKLQKVAVDEALDNEASYSDSSKQATKAAKLNYEAQENRFELSFNKAYNNIKEKQRLLAVANEAYQLELKNYSIAEKKFKLGEISQLELKSANDTLLAKTDEKNAANTEVITAIQNYKWIVKGTVI